MGGVKVVWCQGGVVKRWSGVKAGMASKQHGVDVVRRWQGSGWKVKIADASRVSEEPCGGSREEERRAAGVGTPAYGFRVKRGAKANTGKFG